MGSVIVAENLGKLFRRYHTNRPRTVYEALLGGLRRLGTIERFWGLRNVTFSVAPGRMVGVIGQNGSGKSTLLRLMGGVGRPSEGKIRVNGKIGAILSLGTGFHPDLTGRENVFINGLISGLTRREVTEQFDSIINFAELQDSIDSPLRTYSTGMQMRLAFAVVAHTQPDVLLIDEVLAVGDLSFQRKCLDRISRFRSEGCTIILVSHQMRLIRDLCDEALWINAGRLETYGDAAAVVDRYVAEAKAGQSAAPLSTPAEIGTISDVAAHLHKMGAAD
jgi:lipopolysaccharide transport system ATP-binding protein